MALIAHKEFHSEISLRNFLQLVEVNMFEKSQRLFKVVWLAAYDAYASMRVSRHHSCCFTKKGV